MNVCFTLNNPSDPIAFDVEKMHYLVYQREIGENGTPHFQGYCELKKQTAMSVVKELLGGPTVHLEKRRGTAGQAIAYCKKDETRTEGSQPVEFGEPKATSQGARSDLIAFKDDIQQGKRKRDLIEDHLTVIAKYPKLYDTINYKRPKRTEELKVILLIGPTGLGKTRFVMEHHADDDDFYIAPLSNGTMWYDTFDGHKSVMLDDFAGAASHMTLTSLLRLLDRYPVLVPTKGSHTWWLPNCIYVTTNILPALWYKWENRAEQYKALARRFTTVLLFHQPEEAEDQVWAEAPDTWWKDNAPHDAAQLYNFE